MGACRWNLDTHNSCCSGTVTFGAELECQRQKVGQQQGICKEFVIRIDAIDGNRKTILYIMADS